MGKHDWFVAKLRCEHCGAVSEADSSTNIQTQIAVYPDRKCFGVGDYIDMEFDDVEGFGYICLNRPLDLRTFSVIECWDCTSCRRWPSNWVLVEIANATIVSMNSILMDKSWEERANYITDGIEYHGEWMVRGSELWPKS